VEILATYLRFMQLVVHGFHNVVTGPTFLEIHDFFGELYPAYEKDYDSVIERMMGLGQSVDFKQITKDAAYLFCEKFGATKPKEMLEQLLDCEKMLCELVAKADVGASKGTQQLITEIANQSEMRQYKIGQIIKD
jgi:DNA-binding ferritin-like protein